MKKIKQVHPKLYLKIINSNSDVLLIYKQNKFNIKGDRVILQESLNKQFIDVDHVVFLRKKNSEQQDMLKKYIKIQKKVLNKYEKIRNYDASNIVRNCINLLINFNEEFNQWFKNIDYE